MSLQQNSAAVAAARAHVEAWGKRDYEAARETHLVVLCDNTLSRPHARLRVDLDGRLARQYIETRWWPKWCANPLDLGD
jgi:hypothetical protein